MSEHFFEVDILFITAFLFSCSFHYGLSDVTRGRLKNKNDKIKKKRNRQRQKKVSASLSRCTNWLFGTCRIPYESDKVRLWLSLKLLLSLRETVSHWVVLTSWVNEFFKSVDVVDSVSFVVFDSWQKNLMCRHFQQERLLYYVLLFGYDFFYNVSANPSDVSKWEFGSLVIRFRLQYVALVFICKDEAFAFFS